MVNILELVVQKRYIVLQNDNQSQYAQFFHGKLDFLQCAMLLGT